MLAYGRSLAFLLVASLANVACSSSSGSDEEPEPESETPAKSWELLVEGGWELPAGTEGYYCARATLDHDVLAGGFRAISPLGTHHTVLTMVTDPTEPDGVFPCTAGTLGLNMVFGSGVGTNEITFPEGVAVRIPAGTQLLLNLHLFNTATSAIDGVSGTEVATIAEEDLVHEAEIILAGKTQGLTVEPGVTTQHGRCEMSHDVTVFMVSPHMHQLGTHAVATAHPSGGSPTVLVDAPYDFEQQVFYPVDPFMELAQGDEITVDCTYDNPTRDTVYFGDSSLEEMCFVGVYRYPKQEEFFICDSDGFSAGDLTLAGPPCAEDGAPGNELGVGRQCTAGGGECAGATADFCMADFLGGEYPNFCTTQCSSDADCGSDAACLGQGGQTACIPSHCDAPMLAPSMP